MGVYIKGMEMPTSCYACDFAYQDQDSEHNVYWTCAADHKAAGMYERREDCPLIEVPPHGRLIDADELIKDECNHCDGECGIVDCDCLGCKNHHCRCDFIKGVLEMPTVVEADGDC